jgi:hypothetical protein
MISPETKQSIKNRIKKFRESRFGSKYEAIITILMFVLAGYSVLYDVPQTKLEVTCNQYCSELIQKCNGVGFFNINLSNSASPIPLNSTKEFNFSDINLTEIKNIYNPKNITQSK